MTDDERRAIEEFTAELAAFRIDCGKPSFRRMESLTKKRNRGQVTGQALPRATASDAINAKKLPAVAVVIAFVESCKDAAQEDGLVLNEHDPRRLTLWWQSKWVTVNTAGAASESSGAGRRDAPEHPPLPPERLTPLETRWPGGMMWVPDVEQSCYFILANSYMEARTGFFAPLPGVLENIADMRRCLEQVAPWMPVEIALDQPLKAVAEMLESVAQRTRDVLVVHVLGHGYLDEERMHLRLSMPDTDIERFAQTSLDLTGIVEQLRARSEAKAIVVIVDTCFAAAAVTPSAKLPESVFVLAASNANGMAFDQPTSLTRVWADVLQNGVYEVPYPMLSMQLAAAATAQRVEQLLAGRQLPVIFHSGNADKIAIGMNRRTRPRPEEDGVLIAR